MTGPHPGTMAPPRDEARGGAVIRFARAAVREPFTRRAGREAVYCLLAAPLGLGCFLLTVGMLLPSLAVSGSVFGTVVGLLMIILTMRVTRRIAGLHRWLAARILGDRVAAPPGFRPGHGVLGRLDARLKDGTAWRAIAYMLVKLPVAIVQFWALAFWVSGIVNLSYPLWWPLFRNHPAGTTLRPVVAMTPFPAGNLTVTTWGQTLLVALLGALLVIAAPWLTRGTVVADRWLLRQLLGTGTLAQRVTELEQARARVVDDSAALLRQVERDLHDGAQVRLATMAMNLGMAKEKLGRDGDPPTGPDLARARELIDTAHTGAKEALVELRELVRGIHPPVLDTGLAEALATLAAGSAIPVSVSADLPVRPTPAIETIAYFCAAELLANATKHSGANKIEVKIQIRDTERTRVLHLAVRDDGTGGAATARGSGLSGLARRVATVDGRLDIASPPGGPTAVAVELPLRA